MGSDSAKLLQIEKQRVLDVKDDEGVTALMQIACNRHLVTAVLRRVMESHGKSSQGRPPKAMSLSLARDSRPYAVSFPQHSAIAAAL